MITLTIDGTTQLPCPHCGTAEHLAENEWWFDEPRGDVVAVECNQCLTSAPVAIWNELPRREAP